MRRVEKAIEQGRQQAITAVEVHESESTPIKWMSKMGIAAIALGAVSMTFVPFPVSVACIYVGMLLIFVDLLVHQFPHHRWFKPLAIVSLFTLMAAFTWKIVCHNAPLLCTYRQDGTGAVHLYIDNGNSDDLHDLDFTIHLADQHYIAQVGQITRLGSCSLFPVAPGKADSGDSLASVPSPVPQGAHSFDMQMIGSFQRVRCTELPNNSILELGMFVVTEKDLKTPVAPGQIVLRGSYIGQGKPFKINQNVTTFVEQGSKQP